MNPHPQQVVTLFREHFGEKEFVGIEIGTGEGEVTVELLNNFPNLKMLYTIDPYLYFPGTEFEASLFDQNWHDNRKYKAVKLLLDTHPNRCTHLCIGSDEAVTLTPNEVDFVWVDGDHTVSQVIKDIKNYYPKVGFRGIFGGHDSHQVLTLVKESVTETVIEGADLTWWIIKR